MLLVAPLVVGISRSTLEERFCKTKTQVLVSQNDYSAPLLASSPQWNAEIHPKSHPDSKGNQAFEKGTQSSGSTPTTIRATAKTKGAPKPPPQEPRPVVLVRADRVTEPKVLTASWYGPGFHGRNMANGKRFDMRDPTIVAHRSLPLGTRIEVTNPENGRRAELVVQDRGPYIRGRELDVSYAAAERLGFARNGLARLLMRVI